MTARRTRPDPHESARRGDKNKDVAKVGLPDLVLRWNLSAGRSVQLNRGNLYSGVEPWSRVSASSSPSERRASDSGSVESLIRNLAVSLVSALMASASGLGAPAPAKPPQPPPASSAKPVSISVPRPLLPDSFAGWVISQPPKTVSDPDQADNDNVAALKEYGFQSAVL